MNIDTLLIWQSACLSHTGMVRELNEDACLNLPELGLWVVADGMGGHEAGDVASQMIVDRFSDLNEPRDLNSFIDASHQSLLDINAHLRKLASEHYANRTIGSTVVILLAFKNSFACLWVGDSRLYLHRNGLLEQVTRDHSMVQEYVTEGRMSLEEANKSDIANVLTRAVGAHDELEVDITSGEMKHDDAFLLCSDGLYREVAEEKIAELLNQNDCNSVTEKLVQHALDNGAADNITAAVIHIRETPY